MVLEVSLLHNTVVNNLTLDNLLLDAVVDADAYAPSLRDMVDSGMWHVVGESPWRKPADLSGNVAAYQFVTYQKAR